MSTPDDFMRRYAAAVAAEDYAFLLAGVRDAVGEDFDDLDDEPAPEPVRHITTIAGQRVPLIDPYGDIFSWDAP